MNIKKNIKIIFFNIFKNNELIIIIKKKKKYINI